MMLHKLSEDIVFKKVNNNTFTAECESSKMEKYIYDIVKSFTATNPEKFSMVMDVVLGEAIMGRIVADSFLMKHENLLQSEGSHVIVRFTVNERIYNFSIARNSKVLGGIIYGLLPLN